MSSIAAKYAVVDGKTKFLPVKTLTYYNNSTSHYVLVPFTYANNVLDVATIPGFTPSDGEGQNNGFSWRMVKEMGGLGLVQRLGPDFIDWASSYIGGVDSGSISIFTAPIMTKVQMSVPSSSSILNSQYAARTGLSEPPTGDQFVTGSDSTNWDTAWVFKTPLVLKYRSSGTVYYASFYTQFTNPQ